MKTEALLQALKTGQYNTKLEDIYVDVSLVERQRNRYIKAVETFVSLYGNCDVEIYSAPGRSEVGGNHTDHQHGKVLAAAINLDVIAVVAKTQGTVKIVSDTYDIESIAIDDLSARVKEEGTSASLIRGVFARCKELGHVIGGFNGYLTSDVLIGSGLSSSAAFEVMIGTIISGLYNEQKIDPVEIAQIGQYAENIYFNKPCGLMDQCASSVGSLISIDFKDTAHPIVEKVDVDFSKFGYSLCIVDTKGSHADLTHEYASIPHDMEAVAHVFGKEVLREVTEEEFFANLDKVRVICKDRATLRAIHLFEENKRVEQEVLALRKEDFNAFKQLVVASGNSSYKFLQNVFASSDVQNQGVSIALAMSEKILKDHGVCRVHGGGFAGTIQIFVEDGFVDRYKHEIEKVFGKDTCHVLKVRKYGGIKVI